jgi:hypothetical protein
MRERAVIKYLRGAGMGLVRLAVIRQSDNTELGRYTYNPDSEASANALDEHLADVQGRYQVDIVED